MHMKLKIKYGISQSHKLSLFFTLMSLLIPCVLMAQPEEEEVPAENEIATLDEFALESSQNVGYRAANSVSVGSIQIPLIRTPQSIEVLTEELMEDLNMDDIRDTFDYSTVVRSENVRFGTPADFNIRGFEVSSVFRNGLQFETINDGVNLSRVEFIKGPAAVLLGQSRPGGLINFMTKKPIARKGGSLTTKVGTQDFYRVALDLHGPLPVFGKESETLTYRLMGSYTNEQFDQDLTEEEKTFINPVVTWAPNDRLNWTVSFEYANFHSVPTMEIPFDRVADPETDNPLKVRRLRDVPNDVSFAVPKLFSDVESWDLYNDFQYRIIETSTLSVSFRNRFSRTEMNRQRLRQYVQDDDPAEGNPQFDSNIILFDNFEDKQLRSTNELTANWKFMEGHETQFLIGAELDQSKRPLGERVFTFGDAVSTVDDFITGNVPQGVLDVEGLPENVGDFDLIDASIPQDKDWQTYMLNYLKLFDERINILTGVRFQDGDFFDFGSGETVYQLGGTFSPIPQLSLFGLFNESFQPQNTARTFNRETGEIEIGLPPETGEALEFGVKFELLEGRLGGSVSYFDIDRTGIARRDQEAFDMGLGFVFKASGSENSQGVDFNVHYMPVDNYQIRFSAQKTDTKVVSNDTDPILIGVPLETAPNDWRVSFWNKYDFTTGPLDGFSLGLGVIHTDEVFPSSANVTRRDLKVPGWTRVDLAAFYTLNWNEREVRFSVNVKNLLDDDNNFETRFVLAEGISADFGMSVSW